MSVEPPLDPLVQARAAARQLKSAYRLWRRFHHVAKPYTAEVTSGTDESQAGTTGRVLLAMSDEEARALAGVLIDAAWPDSAGADPDE